MPRFRVQGLLLLLRVWGGELLRVKLESVEVINLWDGGNLRDLSNGNLIWA